MRSKVVFATVIAALACGMVFAANTNLDNVHQVTGEVPTRGNGTFSSFNVTLVQTGPLMADVGLVAATTGATTNTGGEAVLLYGQIYDYPWQPPYGTSNTFVSGSTVITPRVPDGGPWSATFSFTVPVVNDYQAWGLAYNGFYPGIPWLTSISTGFWWQNRTTAYTPPVTIDDVQPPTPTPPPGGYGGEPIPTLNWLGILAMIAIMAGIAVLVMVGRK